jgi:protocatechuate 3,4-dioxygenase beta subunit
MKNLMLIILFISAIVNTSCSQSHTNSPKEKNVGGQCEGCEAALEYGNEKLNAIDTLPDFYDVGARLLVTGTIYLRDGKTPAKDIILYIYHTNQKGIYPQKGDEKGWGKRHGYVRGWIKTNADGKYSFYTLRPASYPEGRNPAHIHPVIKEPGLSPYSIDEYLFEGDPFLTDEEKKRQEKRGGSGVLKVIPGDDGIGVMNRDIVLGLNIPGY